MVAKEEDMKVLGCNDRRHRQLKDGEEKEEADESKSQKQWPPPEAINGTRLQVVVASVCEWSRSNRFSSFSLVIVVYGIH